MEDAAGFLTNLALGDALSGIGFGDAGESLQRVKGFQSKSLVDRSAIYNEAYADDDLSEDDDAIRAEVGDDVEAAVDSDLRVPALQRLSGEEDDYDEEVTTPMELDAVVSRADVAMDDEEPLLLPPPIDVKQLFPTFAENKVIDFTDLLSTRPRKRQKLANNPVKIALPPVNEIPEARSTRHLVKELSAFGENRNRMPLSEMIGDVVPKVTVRNTQRGVHTDDAYAALAQQTNQWALPDVDMLSGGKGLIQLMDWDNDVIWDMPTEPDDFKRRHMLEGRQPGEDLPFRNADLETGDWSESIIWDPHTPYLDFTRLQINVNDPDLVVRRPGEDDAAANAGPENALGKRRRGGAMWGRDAQMDRYNMSNDRIYESLRESRKKVVRQTFGVLDVLHSWPAIKLQLPFYRTSLSKHEARAFHRPALQFPSNVAMTFSKVRTAKKRKDASSKATSVSARRSKMDNPIKHTTDLSLKDTVPFILTEYSEEYPPIMNNTGMGSIFVNYYRKKDAKDESTPKCELGQPFILDVNDESPFLKFGIVEPGQVVPSIYNNLFRAPLFKQTAYPTDFLCIRTTSSGEVSYYLREIKQLFIVGQTYPLMEVPGPHSRKVTSMHKTRLQAISARLIDRAPHNRVKIQKLIRYFPDTSELQMRQRLKEFMEYVRRGPNQGFWVLKSNARTYEDAMRDVRPEDCVLAESMQVGQRYLLDAGYGKVGEEEVAEEEDETKMDVEQQLAPWIVTKNFMNAAQNKAMLRLHGEGDPTGRGEAFNFVRVSMKEIFLREGETMDERQAEMQRRPKSSHKYNVAEQQEIYKQEIERIWKSQFKALSSKTVAKYTEEDKIRWEKRERAAALAALTPGALIGGTPAADGYGMPSPGQGSNSGQEILKVLRIKRLGKDGEWTTEIVKDAAVIRAYVRHRTTIEEENTKAEELEPTDDATMNERRKKKLEDYIANLKHNQERRMQRKNAAAGVVVDPLLGGIPTRKPRGSKAETTRKCGNCGQVGHMKTNKRCPRWAEFNDPNRDKSKPAPVPALADGASPGPSAPGTPAATIDSPATPFQSFAGTPFAMPT